MLFVSCPVIVQWWPGKFPLGGLIILSIRLHLGDHTEMWRTKLILFGFDYFSNVSVTYVEAECIYDD